jgi:hypothetical protein
VSIAVWMWAVWILVGFAMEMTALFNSTPNDTLTGTLVNHVPGAWLLLAAAWVSAHFAEAVRHKGEER